METKVRRKVQPEWVLTGIMLLCAALLVWMVILSKPYIPGKEDPLAVHPHAAATAPAQTEQEEEMDPAQLHHDQTEPAEPEETVQPTIPPEANPYGKLDFQYNRNNYLYSLKTDSYPGIDVSAFQGNIDWEQVRASGIEFAIIRLGYRGYGKSGKLVEDEYAQDNLKGATEAGLPIGAYFFSQALSIEEADEEIEFMLEILGDRPIALCRELTKLHEETFRCTIGEAVAHYQENAPRGEYVLVVEGAPRREKSTLSLEEAVAQVLELKDQAEIVIGINRSAEQYEKLNNQLREEEMKKQVQKEVRDANQQIQKQQETITMLENTITELQQKLAEKEEEIKEMNEKKQTVPTQIPVQYVATFPGVQNQPPVQAVIERTQSKNTGMYTMLGKLAFKKKSKQDIVSLVASGDLTTEQLVQIRLAMEKELTEEQLLELIHSNASPDQMKEIIEIAVLENSMN